MLFDVVADPAETRELSKANPDVVKTMLERLEYYQSRVSRSCVSITPRTHFIRFE